MPDATIAFAGDETAVREQAATEYEALLAEVPPLADAAGRNNLRIRLSRAAAQRPGMPVLQRFGSFAELPSAVQRRALVHVYCEESDAKVSVEAVLGLKHNQR